MRPSTIFAIVVAGAFIALGAWYVSSDKTSKTPDQPAGQTTADANKAPDASAKLKGQADTTARKSSPAKTPSGVATLTRDRKLPTPAQTPRTMGPQPSTRPASNLRINRPSLGDVGTGSVAALDSAGPTTQPSLSGISTAGINVPTTQPVAGTVQPATARQPLMPKRELPTSAAAAKAELKTHTIQRGDTFTALAVKYFGHAKYANKIVEANPDLDPRRLHVGAKVKIPDLEEKQASTKAVSSTAVASTDSKTAPVAIPAGLPKNPAVTPVKAQPVPTDRSYTVKAGEGWYSLAQQFLGNGNRWTELYELNKGRVPRNPHDLRAGMVIEVPSKTVTQ